MKLSNEVKIGLVVLLASVSVYIGFSYLKGASLFKKERQFYGVYERVDGLSTDNGVELNGFRIGRVNSIDLIPGQSGKILVGFVIDHEGVSVPRNSTALIKSLDLFGSKAIELVMGDSPLSANEGDTLISAIEGDLKAEVDERLRPLESKVNALIGSIDSTVIIVQSILNEETRQNLDKAFASIPRSFQTIETTFKRIDTVVAREQERIDDIMANVQSIADNIAGNNENITRILDNFSQISDSLAKADLVRTVQKAGDAMESVASVMERIERGEGTVGMLVRNDTLYQNLQAATLELDKLLEDMRVNPKRYVHFSVFGRREKPQDKPKKRARPEKE